MLNEEQQVLQNDSGKEVISLFKTVKNQLVGALNKESRFEQMLE